MSDSASSSRSVEPSRPDRDTTDFRAEHPSNTQDLPPLRDDQPTIISSQTPIPLPPTSSSAHRIFQGKFDPGDRLGEYELVQLAGGGGMGRVFRARDVRLDRPVALKVLSPEQAADEETLQRFRNEGRSAARLDHENIVRVYHVGEDQGLHYIAFEFIEGMNIRALVERKGPLSLAEAVSYSLQVAEALTHSAQHDVIHRDVKPSNILVTPEGHVKLIDLGLARLRKVDTEAADLTASGVTLGTFDYISPEQARDPRNADVRSDIYSLGCTLFYMLAGRPPFPEGTVLQKLLQHQGDQPPDIREFRPELPEEAARVMQKMLAKNPSHRYSHPTELVEDLTGLAYHVGLHPLGSRGKIFVAPREPTVSMLQRHLPWIVPVAALVCIVFLLDFFWGRPTADQDAGPSVAVSTPTKPAADEPDPEAETPIDQPAEAVASSASNGSGGANEPLDDAPPEETSADSPVLVATETNTANRRLLDRLTENGLRPDRMDGGVSVAEGMAADFGLVSLDQAPMAYLTGAEGTLGSSSANGLRSAVPPKQSGLLIVTQSPQGDNEFGTLNAACNAAGNHDVIELRYNGRREERPVSLTNLKTTIRSGDGYRPIIVFRPSGKEVDPLKYPRSMFTVTAGKLSLINLAIELHVPREVSADCWTLFEVRSGQETRLEKCWLSISNASDKLAAYHEDVAFFEVQSAPGADLMMTAEDRSAAPQPVVIELVDCVARGEATLLRTTDRQPTRMLWDNGLLVTTERFLSVDADEEASRHGEMLRVDLRHVTAVTQGGFCHIADYQPSLHKRAVVLLCADSILVGGPNVSLIEQLGSGTADDFRKQIVFSGDRNFYESFEHLWAIQDYAHEQLAAPMDFDDWQRHWGPEAENLPASNLVVWRDLPDLDRPVHELTPADYALGDAESEVGNPALGYASDGSDVGMQVEQLSKEPPPSEEQD